MNYFRRNSEEGSKVFDKEKKLTQLGRTPSSFFKNPNATMETCINSYDVKNINLKKTKINSIERGSNSKIFDKEFSIRRFSRKPIQTLENTKREPSNTQKAYNNLSLPHFRMKLPKNKHDKLSQVIKNRIRQNTTDVRDKAKQEISEMLHSNKFCNNISRPKKNKTVIHQPSAEEIQKININDLTEIKKDKNPQNFR